jgi:hypothetical protein
VVHGVASGFYASLPFPLVNYIKNYRNEYDRKRDSDPKRCRIEGTMSEKLAAV